MEYLDIVIVLMIVSFCVMCMSFGTLVAVLYYHKNAVKRYKIINKEGVDERLP